MIEPNKPNIKYMKYIVFLTLIPNCNQKKQYFFLNCLYLSLVLYNKTFIFNLINTLYSLDEILI